MRSQQMRRHLPLRRLRGPSGTSTFGADELNPRDRACFLLHVDAEIEHCLMVQYLYAAYSLGGSQVPAEHRDMVRGWQEIILGIAKEEMGHLVTVQNTLRLLGAPLNFGREDFPWDAPFYPFPFTLEPLTMDSLAKYVYAESPQDWTGELAEEIRRKVQELVPAGVQPHRVCELFGDLLPLLSNREALHDSAFDPATVPCQADFAEWGRGYLLGQRGNATGRHPPQTPNVLVVPQASRDDAVAALKAVAEQGEAMLHPHGEQSHFARFLRIYKEMKAVAHEGWLPARRVATNPFVSLDPGANPSRDGGADASSAEAVAQAITDPEAAGWAHLHNVRYRMLLSYLQHAFLLDGGNASAVISPRGAIINGAFGEMYNLRAIAELLMELPRDAARPEAGNAGPPFEMPYTLELPHGEANRWRLHLDLLDASARLTAALREIAPPARQGALAALAQADAQMREIAQRILQAARDRNAGY